MNQQLVLGTGAYGIDSADVAITTLEKLTTLKANSHLLVINGTKVYAAGDETSKQDRIQIFTGLANAASVPGLSPIASSVPIKVGSILGITRDTYVADVVGVYTIAMASLTADTEGEGYIALNDNSYNRTIQNDRVTVNLIKKKGEAVANFVTRLVDKLNKAAVRPGKVAFFKAEVVSTTSVKITMASAHTDFTVAMQGILEGLTMVVTTAPKPSTTRSIDILETEKEYSGNQGNGNYEKLTDAWWSLPQQTVMSTTYDIINISFQGEHDTPQNRQRSAVMNLKIAVPAAQAVAFTTLLSNAFNKSVAVYTSGVKVDLVEDADGGETSEGGEV